MEMLRIILVLTLTALTTGCKVAPVDGPGMERDTTELTDPAAPSAETTPTTEAYNARINADGHVELTWNDEEFAKIAAAYGGEWVPPQSNLVAGLDESLVQLYKAGSPTDPGSLFLILRSADGHVGIYSILDLVLNGHLASSGALEGITGATDVRESTTQPRHMVAVKKDGKELILPDSRQFRGRYTLRGTKAEIYLTGDWNLYLNQKGQTEADEYTTTGHYRIVGTRDTARYAQNRFAAHLPEGELQFSLKQTTGGIVFNFTRVPQDSPLPVGKDISATRE